METLSGEVDMKVESEFPNIANDWRTSIPFGTPDFSREEKGVRFNTAMGFHKGSELDLKSAAIPVEDQRNLPETLSKVQQGNNIGTGRIKLEDVELLAIRGHRKLGEDEMPEIRLYRVLKPEISDVVAA